MKGDEARQGKVLDSINKINWMGRQGTGFARRAEEG
jgi:hypothetical protein